jgi:SAM-dependent methyltransferase
MSQSSHLVFQASRGAVFQLDADGQFLVLPTPTAAPIFGVTLDHLTVLNAFSHPSTIPGAHKRLSLQPLEPPIEALIDDLMSWGLLTVHNTSRGLTGGFGHIESHIPMVADTHRVLAYAEAIRAHVPGRMVAELGCGTGVLSLIAAQAGARSVWAVEESDIATVAEELLDDHCRQGRARVVRANSFDVTPPEPVDVLVHELFGVDPLDENILRIIDDARRRWLKPGGRLLPMGFSIRACAVGGPSWRDGPTARQKIQQLAEELQLDLDPILHAGAKMPIRRIDPPIARPTPDELLSHPCTVVEIDLRVPSGSVEHPEHRLTIQRDGDVGAILMWFDIQLDERRTLSASPFSAPTHWHWQVWDLPEIIPVSPGQSLVLRLSLQAVDGCPQVELIDVVPA